MLKYSELAAERVFHALGDPTRRALVERLSEAPASVSQLAEPLDISLAAVLQHVAVLEQSGLIRTEKVGRVRTCTIVPGGLSVIEQWIADRRSLWERRFDRLGRILAERETPE
jgi:DNA-binding transcriptional ArsR family regulator